MHIHCMESNRSGCIEYISVSLCVGIALVFTSESSVLEVAMVLYVYRSKFENNPFTTEFRRVKVRLRLRVFFAGK